ncbi:hypothetical protein GCM10011344_14860 [Dokdonia pacifica]|uniref:Uncharacterized protein n=1 Tax=Dokdonia pacifica TaxID=1627892 RepID=A0A238W4M6_9FLAO|nr:hypothetical protein [Dokdonia pacifica]GGG15290.1 hypothetical protein GCM10011344_14860 [Dokdonia pacifica]SNR41113.1 hypothetical protein SAMN06265376_101658 [Dokdonia pacifica]
MAKKIIIPTVDPKKRDGDSSPNRIPDSDRPKINPNKGGGTDVRPKIKDDN